MTNMVDISQTLKVHKLTIGELSTNCYIVETKNKNAIIIDPADSADLILKCLEINGLIPKKILLTHGHCDHILAVSNLVGLFGIPVYIHESDEIMMTDREANLFDYIKMNGSFNPIKGVITTSDGDVITQDELSFTIMNTPGHTNGSSLYLCDDVIFSGDTLFAGSIGRVDHMFGDYRKIKESLVKIDNIEGEFTLCPGHGINSTLGHERSTNIYFANNYGEDI